MDYNSRSRPLFFSLNLLSSNVPFAVAEVVFLNSLMLQMDLVLQNDRESESTANKKTCIIHNSLDENIAIT